MKSRLLFKLLTLLIVAINFIVHINRPVFADTTTLSKGAIVINEINWAGSIINNKSESDDEWIELFNTTASPVSIPILEVVIGTTSYKIPDVIIQPLSYYVITRWAVDKSAISVSNKISLGAIANSGFQIKLLVSGVLIDEVSTGGKVPGAGSNETTSKASMAKVSPTADGLDTNSWKTSTTRANIRRGFEYCRNYGTPGSENFPVTNETKIEFEDSCNASLQYNSDKTSIILNTQGESTFEFSSYDFGSEASLYELQLNSSAIKISDTSSFNLNVNFNPDYAIALEKILLSDAGISEKTTFRFVKPSFLTNGALSITSNISSGESISLDSLIIRKAANNNSGYEVVSPVFPYRSVKEINTQLHDSYRATIKINFSEFGTIIDPVEKIGTFSIVNPFTNAVWSRAVYKKDVALNKEIILTTDLISDTYGYYQYEFSTPNIIHYTITSLKLEKDVKQTVHELDALELLVPNTKFSYIDNNIRLNKIVSSPGKVIQIINSPLCSLLSNCKFEVGIKIINITESIVNPQIADMFFLGTDKNGKKYHKILHLKADELKNTQSINSVLPYPNLEKISISIFNYQNADLEIGRITLSETQLPVITPQNTNVLLKSTKTLNWSALVTVDHNVFNGKIIDILTPQNTLEPGEYTVKISGKRSSIENSGDNLLQFTAYDETAKKLFNRIIEEDDLSSFETITFDDTFTTTAPSEIHIVISFADGEWYEGAYIGIEKIEMVKK